MSIDQLFHDQYGIVTRAQAKAVGLSDRQIDRRVGQGAWVREYAAVFRSAAVKASWHGRLLAATMATGGIASHRCAAALHELDLYRTPVPEVVVPVGSWAAKLEGARVHRTTQWLTRRETEIAGIRCTGVDRAILDCGAVASPRTVERLAEAAIRKRLTSWEDLLVCLRVHSAQGRDGCLNLRRVLETRLIDQTIPLSDFSRVVANLLVDGGVEEPKLEYRILDDFGHLILQTDLAWPSKRKAWELDGLQHHFGRDDVERDRRKRNTAKSHGWNIQEILWSMYIDEPESLVSMAHRFLAG